MQIKELHVVYATCFPGMPMDKNELFCTLYNICSLVELYGAQNVTVLISTHSIESGSNEHWTATGMDNIYRFRFLMRYVLDTVPEVYSFPVCHPLPALCDTGKQGRGHNIAYMKERQLEACRMLYERLKTECTRPLLFFCDADMVLNREGIKKGMHGSRQEFLHLYPYVLRDMLRCPEDQAGLFAADLSITADPLLTQVYRYEVHEDGLLYRPQAPDCLFKKRCEKSGRVEVSRVKNCRTLHFRDYVTAGLYADGEMSVVSMVEDYSLDANTEMFSRFRDEVDYFMNAKL